MSETTEQKLKSLTDAWKLAKRMEQDWNDQRIAIESEIYELEQHKLPERGTHTTVTGMKIATGYSEEWDQEKLNEAYSQWPVDTVKFPFAGIWKADGKAISVMRDSLPELYRLLQPCLTLKPKKPSFSIPEKK